MAVLVLRKASIVMFGSPHTLVSSSCHGNKSRTAIGRFFISPHRMAAIYDKIKTPRQFGDGSNLRQNKNTSIWGWQQSTTKSKHHINLGMAAIYDKIKTPRQFGDGSNLRQNQNTTSIWGSP